MAPGFGDLFRPRGGVGNGVRILIGWRYIRYQIGDRGLDFAIEPGEDNHGVVSFPDPQTWTATAPEWARSQRREVLRALRSSPRARHLTWLDTPTPVRECGRLGPDR